MESDTHNPASEPEDEGSPSRYVTIQLASKKTGLSQGAIRHKKDRGVWKENSEWKRGPDNRIYIDLEGYERWVEKGRV